MPSPPVRIDPRRRHSEPSAIHLSLPVRGENAERRSRTYPGGPLQRSLDISVEEGWA